MNMGINGDGRDLVAFRENDIGALAADSSQFCQLFHVIRNLAVILFHQLSAHRNDIGGLVTVQSDGTDQLFHILLICLCHPEGIRIGFKQCRGDLIDRDISGLG